jgi:Protein  of unknown function (DUF3018)
MSNRSAKSSAPSASKRMSAYRDRLRASGLRPVQVWLPDTRSADFANQCAIEARAIAAGGKGEDELQAFVDAVSDWPAA